jgi:hypothetical protein
VNDLRLSIHQTYGQIGVETHWASQDIRSPHGDLQIQQPHAQMNIQSPHGELQIDQSAAWSALAKGSVLQLNNSIYSQIPGVVLQAIAKTVEDGNRMAQITTPSDAFADIAGDVFQRENPIEYVTGAAYDNVKINYVPREPEISFTPQKPHVQYTPHKPEIQYNPGNVDIYMRQKNSIQITVSRYDLYK